VTVHSGEELVVRLYFSCGSGSAGRYATLKDVKAVGTVLGGTVPLQLLTFSGNVNKQGFVQLQWSTTNEINLSGYEIERSADGVHFSTMGNINAGNLSTNQYHFTDQLPFAGNYYYRLKIRDNLQRIEYSRVVMINYFISKPVYIYPNPVGDVLHVEHEKAMKGSVIEIYAKDGRKIQSYELKTEDIINNIPVAHLAKGAYYLVFVNGDAVNNTDFIKQ
jgi:hypothetical protein